MKKIVAILMAMIMVISMTVVLAGGVATTKENQSEKVPVIIMFKDKTDKDLIKQHGGEIKCVYQIEPAVAASLPQKAIDALEKNPEIAFIVPDLEIFTMAETLEWGVDRIDADIVHEYNRGTGVKVAIMDTGIDYNHPDLAANYKGGYDFGGRLVWQGRNDDDPMDKQGHGTHCAGIVAAVKGNDIGVIGVAPEAYLYAVKVFDDRGNGRYSDVIEGLEWCINNNVQVISMSFGSAYSAGDPGIEPWINDAYDAGILLVGAAGNEGSGVDTVIYPARYANVIAVAATDSNDNRASFSSTGPNVELSAPGVSIYSTIPGGYGTKSGTSMACPHVSGTAALVIASGGGDVRQRLKDTADDLGVSGKDNLYGYGLVDADEAAPSTGNQPPVADAGADQTVSDADGNGVEAVTLDGSGSSDPDGSIDTYEWKEGATSLSGAMSFTCNFSVGMHTVTLTVTDDGGASSSDDVIVTVNANQAPVADAGADQTVSDADGNGTEAVTLDGSGSSDLDGSIDTYEWKEGGTLLSGAVSFTRDFSVGTTHTVTLTVTDDGGASSSDDVIVTVNANQPPVADAGPDQTASDADGNGVEAVTLDGAGSYDPDGSIVSYEWKEGETSLSTAVSFTDNFSVGTHTVTLTVTDKGGANSSDDVIVTVTEVPAYTMHIDSIVMSTGSRSAGPKNTFVWAVATVTIVDESDSPVDGATVSGHWSNATSDSDSGVTDGNGEVSLESDSVKNPQPGTKFTFTVDNVAKDSWSYNLSANVITNNSTTAG